MNEKNDKIFLKFQEKLPEFSFTTKVLGKGGFGEVREIHASNSKSFAGKLVKEKRKKGKNSQNNSESSNEELRILLKSLNNPNIVRIFDIIPLNYKEKENQQNEKYNLIIMEKAIFKDLKSVIKAIYKDNQGYLYMPFNEVIGDNLSKFFCKQIVKGIEYLDRNNYIHFDIKPENILIFLKMALKLSDFDLLREIKKSEYIKIPGGTPGYMPPEYYSNQNIRVYPEIAKKHDYFSLGATIFFIKYGFKFLKAINNEDSMINKEYIIDNIEKITTYIQSNILSDKDFRDFLCSLIRIFPEDRPTFEEIIRNKWLNKNYNFISKVKYSFEEDEIKLISELRKSDFLMEKEEIFQNHNIKTKKFIFSQKYKNKYKY